MTPGPQQSALQAVVSPHITAALQAVVSMGVVGLNKQLFGSRLAPRLKACLVVVVWQNTT